MKTAVLVLKRMMEKFKKEVHLLVLMCDFGHMVGNGHCWKSTQLWTTGLSAPLFTGLSMSCLLLSNHHNTVSYFFQSHSSSQHNNADLSSKLRAGNQGPVPAGELLRWLSIRLAMALEPKRGERDKDTEGSDFTAANYHNHSKMSRHWFEFIILVLANTLLWMSGWVCGKEAKVPTELKECPARQKG